MLSERKRTQLEARRSLQKCVNTIEDISANKNSTLEIELLLTNMESLSLSKQKTALEQKKYTQLEAIRTARSKYSQ